MKRLNILIALLLSSLVFSCSPDNGDNSDNSDIDNSSSEEEKDERNISSLNPMDEPKINRQFYLNHIGDIYNTWKSYEGDGIIIAVIDVGFKYNHEDFTYEDGTSKISDKSAAFRIEGTHVKVDVDKTKLGVTSLDLEHDPWYNNSHGTFCAGIAAAGINNKGVMGIAPLAKLMLLKTDGHPLSICEAFRYASDNGAKVISISIGSYSDYEGDLKWSKSSLDLTTAFNNAVNYCKEKGTVVISAAGNGGGSSRATEYTYPGATTGVIGVGGLMANETTRVWSGSSYNSSSQYMFCDVFAPADGMFGCSDYSPYYDGGTEDDHYKWRGTSFAAPIVAGMAALYFEKYPNATPDQFEAALYKSAHDFSDPDSGLTKSNTGKGRVDIGALLDTKYSEPIDIKVQYSGTTLYAFAWNDEGTKSLDNLDWPGKKLTKSGGYYTVTIDPTQYQNIIFNNGGDSYKTVTLSPTSFINGDVYNLSSAINENNLRIGLYK